MKIDVSIAENIIKKFTNKPGALIPILQNIQNDYGYLPQEVINKISEKLNITTAEIYGVATFYTQFRLNPIGKHTIKVCHGTACHVGGANILDEMLKNKLGINFGETTKDGMFTVLPVACLGCCSLAPAVMINNKTYGKLNNDKLSKIIDSYINKEKQG